MINAYRAVVADQGRIMSMQTEEIAKLRAELQKALRASQEAKQSIHKAAMAAVPGPNAV